jgi:hypothetical protein
LARDCAPIEEKGIDLGRAAGGAGPPVHVVVTAELTTGHEPDADEPDADEPDTDEPDADEYTDQYAGDVPHGDDWTNEPDTDDYDGWPGSLVRFAVKHELGLAAHAIEHWDDAGDPRPDVKLANADGATVVDELDAHSARIAVTHCLQRESRACCHERQRSSRSSPPPPFLRARGQRSPFQAGLNSEETDVAKQSPVLAFSSGMGPLPDLFDV